jgi:hypothetical protein
MTEIDIRYVTRARMTDPAGDGGRRCERHAPSPPPTNGGLTKVQQLRQRIERGTYAVDSQAVAAAILKRLFGSDDDRPA